MARKTKEKSLPVRVQRIVDACNRGQSLCLTIKKSDVGDDRLYWLEPTGESVGTRSAEMAIGLGLLAPTGDGLFADLPQSWRAAP